jgi:LemA protein
MRNNVDKAWANIDVLLKKRLDLIPNLVEIVKDYTIYEKSVLEDVTKIRASALQAEGVIEKAQGSEAVSTLLNTIFILAENYPDLKASDNFLNLQRELSSIENQIAQRREFYNDSVLLYNTKIKTIPGVFVADLTRCTPREYFKVEGNIEKPVDVIIGGR